MKKTNKTFKRFAAITSASLLAACAVAPVFTSMTSYAAENQISFKNGTEPETLNSYAAYKIFSGVAKNGSGFGSSAELENIQWAKSGAEAIVDKLKLDTRFGEGEDNDFYACTTAASVAEVLKGYTAKSAKAIAFAEVIVDNASLFDKTTGDQGVISVADDGYYVIAQTTQVGVTTAYILGVYDASEGADVNVKVSKPTFEKKIADINDSTDTEKGAWQDSADYDIGDSVPYQLKATLPEDYALYNEYMLIFHDTLDSGLTYDTGSAKYYVNGVEWGTPLVTTENLTDSCNLEFKIDDLKLLTKDEAVIDADDVITIEFTAKLNENAVIGSAGNWNEAYLEYSNNPYFTSGSAGDGVDNDGDGITDEENEEKETTDKTAIDKVVAFTYQTVINKVDETGAALKGAEFKLEKKLADGSKKEIAVVKNDTGTIFTFKGLDDGNYVLTETAAPAGYNMLTEAIEFTITAEHTDGDSPALTSLNTITADATETVITLGKYEANVEFVNGKIIAEIENKSGASLPGTGGIGTTIFYLGGGAMAAIGGIYLISKRRMRKSEE